MSKTFNGLNTIRGLYPDLSETEQVIADYVLHHTDSVIHTTVAQLAKQVGVADSSVINFCKRVGFSGYTELKINLARNLSAPEMLPPGDVSPQDDCATILGKVFASSIQALRDSIGMLDNHEVEQAVQALDDAQRVEFYGVGTSAPIALDAYTRFMRIGLNVAAVTDPHVMRVSSGLLVPGSVAVGISHTGRTIDTVTALRNARMRGATTICISSFLNSPITKHADIRLITSTVETMVVREAVVSRIAHIALLDGLYTCLVARRHDTAIRQLEATRELLMDTRG